MIIFLTQQDVLKLYNLSMNRFGGTEGVRDYNLLISALAQVQILDHYAQPDIYHLGAAYAYFIIKNHPFLDGNKRVGLLSALVFFEKNKITINCPHEELYRIIIKITDSTSSVKELAEFFESCSIDKN